MKLYEITAGIRELKEMFNDPEIDPQAITDTLEGLELSLDEKLVGIAVIVKEMSADVGTIQTEIDRLKDEQDKLKKAQDKLKDYTLTNMRLAKKTAVKDVRATISIKKNPPSVIIADEIAFIKWAEEFAKDLLTFPPQPEPKPNKSAIKANYEKCAEHGVTLQATERIDIK
jgi:uncharacterized small protein (DUF1192 family)